MNPRKFLWAIFAILCCCTIAIATLQRTDVTYASSSTKTRYLRQVFEPAPPATMVDYYAQHSTSSAGQHERNGTDNRKPSFRGCSTYAPTVKEEQPSNVFVIRVEADDPDPGDKIEYSFVRGASERPKFRIDAKTGDIYTVYTFDRDEPIRDKEVCTNFFKNYVIKLLSFASLPRPTFLA